jgi:nitrogenase molybdenum-iron protein alpha chain
MSTINERKALTREKRLSTLSHYNGTLETLAEDVKGEEIKQRIRTFSQVHGDEIIAALSVLTKIEQSAVIVNGSVGCAASGVFFNSQTGADWYSTGLDERDTILGGDEKLRKAVYRAYEEKNPKLIFIVGTPVVAINNDDINSIILELEDELSVKIISIYTDGFKSKSAATGYDIISHSLLKYVVDRNPDEKDGFVNIITYSENAASIAGVVKIFKELEIPYQLVGQYSSADKIAKASHARASVVLNNGEGAYLAAELEENFGVTYIRTEAAVGIRGTRHFIRRIAKVLDIEQKAQEYIENQQKLLDNSVSRSPLVGKTVFLDANFAYAVNFAEFIEKLGGKISGLSVPYVDLENRELVQKLTVYTAKGIPVIVADGQPFEKANVLYKKKADYYFSLYASPAFSSQLGSVPVSAADTAVLGYVGAEEIVKLIRRANVYQKSTDKEFYRQTWLKKSSNWYVKQEVK